jgi:hypothetical protein
MYSREAFESAGNMAKELGTEKAIEMAKKNCRNTELLGFIRNYWKEVLEALLKIK